MTDIRCRTCSTSDLFLMAAKNHLGPDTLERSVGELLRCSGGTSEDPTDVFVREAFQPSEDEDRGLLGRKRMKSAIECMTRLPSGRDTVRGMTVSAAG